MRSCSHNSWIKECKCHVFLIARLMTVRKQHVNMYRVHLMRYCKKSLETDYKVLLVILLYCMAYEAREKTEIILHVM